jgi:hypothetical protein
MPGSKANERELRARLTAILRATPPLMQVLSVARHLSLPDWLVFSGAVMLPCGVAISVVWILLFLAWEIFGLPYGPG